MKTQILTLCLISVLVGISCSEPTPKSLEGIEWTEFGIYEVPLDASVVAGSSAGDQAGSIEGGDQAGTIIGGISGPVAGEVAGEKAGAEAGSTVAGESAGETAGTLAGEGAGEEAGEEAGSTVAGEAMIVEDPQLTFEYATIPELAQITLLERGNNSVLLWIRGAEIWMSVSKSNGELAPPQLLLEHTSEITQLFAEPLLQSNIILFSDVEEVSHFFTLNAVIINEAREALEVKGPESATETALIHQIVKLGLTAPLRVSSQDGKVFIVGAISEDLANQTADSDPDLEPFIEIGQTAWLMVNDSLLNSTLMMSDASLGETWGALMRVAPLSWPLPDSIGWVSGFPMLRFNKAGQCAHLNGALQVSGTTACLDGRGYLVSSASESLLIHLDSAGTLQTTISSAPDLEFGYLVARLEVDAEPDYPTVAQPVYGPYQPHSRSVSLIGQRTVEESDGILRDRLLILEPSGLWVSEEGWPAWPYEGVGAISRHDREAWVYLFDDEYAPRRIRIPLQNNTFLERSPFGLNINLSCRPTVERCDGVDNNCDGVVDNGLCCATGRDPFEAYFIPSAPPTEFFVTDVEAADSSRYAVRVAENQWEIWAIYYGLSNRNMISLGVIEGAHDAVGFTAAGNYSVLVARDDQGEWKAFWNHIGAGVPVKEPESLGCDRALSVGNVGYSPTETSAVVLCDDRVVHLRADTDLDGNLIPSEIHRAPFEDLPSLEWGKLIRHSSRGEASFSFAFQSLAGQSWEVSKISIAKGTGSRLTFSSTQGLNGRLGFDGTQRPDPVYLHRDDSPGVPQALPYLSIDENMKYAAMNSVVDHQRIWRPLTFGRPVTQIEYSEMPSKVIASAPHQDGFGSDFYVVDFKEHEFLNPWVTQPTFSWRSPRLNDETPPTDPINMLWSVLHGNYYNYIGTMFEAGEVSEAGLSLPHGVWAVRLYSVIDCPH